MISGCAREEMSCTATPVRCADQISYAAARPVANGQRRGCRRSLPCPPIKRCRLARARCADSGDLRSCGPRYAKTVASAVLGAYRRVGLANEAKSGGGWVINGSRLAFMDYLWRMLEPDTVTFGKTVHK